MSGAGTLGVPLGGTRRVGGLLGVAGMAQMVKHLPAMWETGVQSLGQEIPWRRKWQPTPVFLPGKFHGQIAKLSELVLASGNSVGNLDCGNEAVIV